MALMIRAESESVMATWCYRHTVYGCTPTVTHARLKTLSNHLPVRRRPLARPGTASGTPPPGRFGHRAVTPPSMIITAPMAESASSDARYAAIAAISSGVTSLPCG